MEKDPAKRFYRRLVDRRHRRTFPQGLARRMKHFRPEHDSEQGRCKRSTVQFGSQSDKAIASESSKQRSLATEPGASSSRHV
jgi:hypothetical protein